LKTILASPELYRFKLELAGYEVALAVNGEEGLQQAKDFHPELILLDLKMPVMNGDEMLEKLRSSDWGALIRVIILTNISRSEIPTNLRFFNVDRYVVKAHTMPSHIVEIVSQVLDR
jgi:CheY-like chemotaxis protein